MSAFARSINNASNKEVTKSLHRILFIVGNAEPGKSGVGDYTRLLADELYRTHHISSDIVSINDFFVRDDIKEENCSSSDNRILRIPNEFGKEAVKQYLQSVFRKTNYSWISLQYVGYAYHPLGFAYPLLDLLRLSEGSCQFHIMFHELWQGLGKHESMISRLKGGLQKSSVRNLIHRINPQAIHTHNAYYFHLLKQLHFDAELLSLFGNISVEQADVPRSRILLRQYGVPAEIEENRNDFLLIGFFGAIYGGWPIELCFRSIASACQKTNKTPILVSIGNAGPGWAKLVEEYGTRFQMISTGFLGESDISQILSTLDFGISTTPYEATGKSGGTMAFLEHGIPVFAGPDMLRPKIHIESYEIPKGVLPMDSNMTEVILSLPQLETNPQAVRQVTQKFAEDLCLLDNHNP